MGPPILYNAHQDINCRAIVTQWPPSLQHVTVQLSGVSLETVKVSLHSVSPFFPLPFFSKKTPVRYGSGAQKVSEFQGNGLNFKIYTFKVTRQLCCKSAWKRTPLHGSLNTSAAIPSFKNLYYTHLTKWPKMSKVCLRLKSDLLWQSWK